jgi:hypothetical protein
VSWLGYRSYSLFLIHQPTLWYASEFLQKFLRVPEGVLLLILLWTVGFAAVLGVGLVLFITVERPCITWAKRVPSSRAPARATSEPASLTEAPGAADAPAAPYPKLAPMTEDPGIVARPQSHPDNAQHPRPEDDRPPGSV